MSGQFHASAALPPGERPPVTHWVGGQVSPRAGLDNVEGYSYAHSVLMSLYVLLF
jgi:hypothetical protein